MKTLSDAPLNRSQIADYLGIYRENSLHWLLSAIECFLEDYSIKNRPLDDYHLWLLLKLTSPPFIAVGRKEGKKRLKRKSIKKALIENPNQFSRFEYHKRLSGDRRAPINFSFIK